MSRITERELSVPDQVEVDITVSEVRVSGPHGQLSLPIVDGVSTTPENGSILIKTESETRHARAMTGTTHALLKNMILGVLNKWEKRLVMQGVGNRVQVQGNSLVFLLGFTHPIEYTLPEGIEVSTPTNTEVVISGIDRQQVGQVAAEIRGLKPPSPYIYKKNKGLIKGIRYEGEYVRRKPMKKHSSSNR